ncbi:DinB family protein [Granulicella tundricola]|uniref:DinB-like domain-containing protein n=1 Tax=Granulicella tundricola (strain ATCC BAA-1859 / DSM 23138 / MP5ACTX9) TaxID=1198114 RepID=E8X4I3_GRATM|nr:DinB family protein [Granulicella tundricola]ADW69393.1 hypothetical protein AciX9_2356 [Granulicella tundricola MP5ACTX9]
MPEPWLRGTLTEIDAVPRQILHALELAAEDCTRWCDDLTEPELNARPYGLPSVAFHMRHIARSLDRLLTYADDRWLDEDQLAALDTEHDPITREPLFQEFTLGLSEAAQRVRAFNPDRYDQKRSVGRNRLPSTLGGLLVHCAEHTQRHVGQMVTTAKLAVAP